MRLNESTRLVGRALQGLGHRLGGLGPWCSYGGLLKETVLRLGAYKLDPLGHICPARDSPRHLANCKFFGRSAVSVPGLNIKKKNPHIGPPLYGTSLISGGAYIGSSIGVHRGCNEGSTSAALTSSEGSDGRRPSVCIGVIRRSISRGTDT